MAEKKKKKKHLNISSGQAGYDAIRSRIKKEGKSKPLEPVKLGGNPMKALDKAIKRGGGGGPGGGRWVKDPKTGRRQWKIM